MSYLGLSAPYALFYVIMFVFIFFLRRKAGLSLPDILVMVLAGVLLGGLITFSDHLLGTGWTVLLVVLTVMTVGSAIMILHRRKEKRSEGENDRFFDDVEEAQVVQVSAEQVEEITPTVQAQPEEVAAAEAPIEQEHEEEVAVEDAPLEQEHEEEVAVEEAPTEQEQAEEMAAETDNNELPDQEESTELVMQHYLEATIAQRSEDWKRASDEYKKALLLPSPWRARMMITEDFVKLLTSVGMYRQAVERLKELYARAVFEAGSASEDGEKILRQITYFEILEKLLHEQRKANLPWALVSPDIRRQAEMDAATYLRNETESFARQTEKGA